MDAAFLRTTTAEAVTDAVRALVDAAAAEVYERYAHSLEPEYAVARVLANLAAAYEWLHPTFDAREPPASSWVAEAEPVPCALDSWARAAVPIRAPAPKHAPAPAGAPTLATALSASGTRGSARHAASVNSGTGASAAGAAGADATLRPRPSLFASHPSAAAVVVPDRATGGRRRHAATVPRGPHPHLLLPDPEAAPECGALDGAGPRAPASAVGGRTTIVRDETSPVPPASPASPAVARPALVLVAPQPRRAPHDGVAATAAAAHAATLRGGAGAGGAGATVVTTTGARGRAVGGALPRTAAPTLAAASSCGSSSGSVAHAAGAHAVGRALAHERRSSEAALLAADARVVGGDASATGGATPTGAWPSGRASVSPTLRARASVVSVGSAPPWLDASRELGARSTSPTRDVRVINALGGH